MNNTYIDMNSSEDVIDESSRVKYGEPTTQYSVDRMRGMISWQIESKINWIDDDLVQVIENNKPILNILVKNRKWDKGGVGIKTKNDYHSTSRIEELSKRKSVPLYVCMNSNRIEDTVDFANLWINREYNEMYKLYPNKIAEINKRRNQ